MKKILALVMAAVLCLGLFAACAPAENSGNTGNGGNEVSLAGTYNVTVWVAEEIVELTKTQIAKFNETNTDGIVINATVTAVGENDAATTMTNDVEAGADIFCFAQDQTVRLIQAGALSKLGAAAQAIIAAANDAGVVSAATSGSDMYAYPLTSDNGYFMYYDKSVIKEADIDSMEALIKACEDAGKMFSFEIEGSAWYTASFFFGAGCHSEWQLAEDGKNFKSVDDDFFGEKGLIAAKAIEKLVKSPAYMNSSKGEDFAAATPSAVVVTGTWAYETISGILGENMGVADLPSYNVDGKDYHLGSFNGCKLMGVKPQTDAVRGAALHKLAQFLTNEQSQMERFEAKGWGPANLNAQKNEKVASAPHLAALFAQNAYSVPQGQIHGSWWDIAKVIPTNIKKATDVAGLQAALDTYKTSMEALFTMSDEVKNAFTVIGSINGDTWTVDLPMTKLEDGTWKSNEAYTMDVGVEFKVRQGKSWDVSFGKDGENFKVETAGTYYVTFDPATETVAIVAAQ